MSLHFKIWIKPLAIIISNSCYYEWISIRIVYVIATIPIRGLVVAEEYIKMAGEMNDLAKVCVESVVMYNYIPFYIRD